MTTAIDPPYPPIDPTTFDLIITGTGLPSSVIAAASSLAGKSVLHLDPNPFYGSHFSSLSFPDLPSFLDSHFSDLELSNFDPQLIDQHSRKFNLDVSGPRVLFCADKCIDLMLKSGASQYVEFKSVDATFIADGAGGLGSVPDSRAAIFKDKSLSLLEKNQLMRFFKLVQGHLSEKQDDVEGNEIGAKISQEEMETPFVEFLTKMKLPPKIKSYTLHHFAIYIYFFLFKFCFFCIYSLNVVWFLCCRIILYAIAMADYDQERAEIGRGLLRTKDGIERLALYSASIGRLVLVLVC